MKEKCDSVVNRGLHMTLRALVQPCLNVGKLLHTSPMTSTDKTLAGLLVLSTHHHSNLPQKLTSARTTHLRDRVGEEAIELFVGTVSHPTPPCRVEVLPDPSQANGHPLA